MPDGCYRPYICRKYDPETKGKVEAAVNYIKNGFLLGRKFASWGELQSQWEYWVNQVGNAKLHETTKEAPCVGLQREQPHFLPMAANEYCTKPAYKTQKVYKDGLVKVLGNRYSVPSSHHGRQVKIKVTEFHVEIRDQNEVPLAMHARCWDKGKRFLVKEHYSRAPSEASDALAKKVEEIYSCPIMVAKLKAQFPRHFREQLRGLISLAEEYPQEVLKRALARLFHHDCISYRNMKQLLVHANKEEGLNGELEMTLFLSVQMPLDLGLEDRPISYYDQATAGGLG